jgi:simple sugar transport system permease protein
MADGDAASPGMRFVRGLVRPTADFLLRALVVMAVIAGFVSLTGTSPLLVFGELLRGAVGSATDLAVTVNRAAPLMIAGVGVALAMRAGAFNMGVEGQIALGGLAASYFGLFLGEVPSPAAIPFVLLLSGVAGALWAGLAGLLSLWRGVNVVIVTLLTNFIALLFVSAIVTGPLNHGQGFPATPVLPESVHMPMILKGMHAGILVGIAAALAGGWLLWRTRFGYRLRIAGDSPDLARYLRFDPRSSFLAGMLISGALAGIAGGVEILGVRHRLFDGFSRNMGWDAIAVALLGGNNPLGVIPAALFFGGLRAATGALQRRSGIPASLATIVQGLVILAVVASGMRKPRPKSGAQPEEGG